MARKPLVLAVCLLAACSRHMNPGAVVLEDDPARLQALREACGRGEYDDGFCLQVHQADLRRLLSGESGPDEYRTLCDLPPIPSSFDEDDGAAP